MSSNYLILCRSLLLPPSIFPSIRDFSMSQFFASCGQRIGVSASALVLKMSNWDGSPLGWTGWLSLQSKGLSRVFSNTTVQKHQFFCTQLSSQSNSHPVLESCTFLRICPFLPRCPFYWHIIVDSSLL